MAQVQVKARMSEQYKQDIKAGSHEFLSDIPKAKGGNESAPDPHELLLGALGACTSITLKMYAQKKGWDLQDVIVNLSDEEIEDPDHAGQKIAKINREIEVSGNLAQEQIDSLKAAANRCPIHKLLSGPNQIATSVHQAK